MKTGIKKYLFSIILLIILISLDQITKMIARQTLTDGTCTLIEGVFEFRLVFNTGVAWGMFGSSPVIISVISVLIMILLTYLYLHIPVEDRKLRILRILLICIVAGAAGNLIDRMIYSSVTDFLYFKLIDFPVFNVADIYVTVSGFLTAILLIFYYKEEDLGNIRFRKKKPGKEPAPERTEDE